MQNIFDMINKFFKALSQTFNSMFGANFNQGNTPHHHGQSGQPFNNNGFDQNAADLHNQFVQEELNRQFMQQSMEEAQKAVTPFDHGGYMQGEGFNPSDTMAADMQRQMDSMNNMNMGGMDMGGMGMF